MWMRKHLAFYLLLAAGFLTRPGLYAQPSERALHLIIYSESGSVVKFPDLLARVHDYVLQLYAAPGELKRLHQDDAVDDQDLKSLPQPFFRAPDRLLMMSFGMSGAALNSLGGRFARATTADSLGAAIAFLARLIAGGETYAGQDNVAIPNFLRSYLPSYQPEGKYAWTFSRYAVVAALRYAAQTLAANQFFDHIYITRIASNFTSDEADNFGKDRDNLQNKLPAGFMFAEEIISEFNKNFRLNKCVSIAVGKRVGTQYPIMVDTYEILPKRPPGMELYTNTVYRRDADSGGVALDSLRVQVDNLPAFALAGGAIIVHPGGKQAGAHAISADTSHFSVDKNIVRWNNLVFQPRAGESLDRNTKIQIKLNVHYESTLDKSLRLPLAVSMTSPKKINVTKAPMATKTTTVLLLLVLLLTAGGLGYFLLYKPPIRVVLDEKKNYELLAPKSKSGDGPIYGIHWSRGGKPVFKISLINISPRYHLLNADVRVTLSRPTRRENVKNTKIWYDVYVGEDSEPLMQFIDLGREIALPAMSPEKKVTLNLCFDFSDQPAPSAQDGAAHEFVFMLERRCGIGRLQTYPLKIFTIRLLPSLEKCWIGFDPGTTGSCVAVGTDHDRIFLINLESTQTEQAFPLADLDANSYPKLSSCISPSWVWLPNDIDEQQLSNPIDSPASSIYYGAQARQEASSGTGRGLAFHSAKKLLGTEIVMPLAGEKETKIAGKTIISLLASRLAVRARAFIAAGLHDEEKRLGANAEALEGKNAVLAVPIAFSSGQINEMKSCFSNLNFAEVLTIYEAEAAALYSLFIRKSQQNEPKLRETGGTMMIVDFGGATLNVSILQYHPPGPRQNKKAIQILSRVGYALGGETINGIIARLAWKQLLRKLDEKLPINIDPFSIEASLNHGLLHNVNGAEDWHGFALAFCNQVEKEKIEAWGAGKDSFRPLDVPFANFFKKHLKYDLPEITKGPRRISISEEEAAVESRRQHEPGSEELAEKMIVSLPLEDVKQSADYQRLVALIRQAATLALELQYKNCSQKIDALLLSGRAIHFPGLEEAIRSELKNIPVIRLDLHEAKIAVAAGAVYYGNQRRNLELSQEMTTCNFGVKVKGEHAEEFAFYNILPIHKKFVDGVAKSDKLSQPIDVTYNRGFLEVYQVFSKPEEAGRILKTKSERYRYQPVGNIPVPAAAKSIENIVMRLDQSSDLTMSVDFDVERDVSMRPTQLKWSEIQNQEASLAEWLPVWQYAAYKMKDAQKKAKA